MRILIVGSGVIGVTSAWYLREAGHEVVVVERQPGPALETSFANAGEISPGYASPWAAPGIPLKALKWLLTRHAPLSIRPTLDLAQYRWLWQMLRNCTRQRYAISKARMVRLAEYSRDCLRQLRQQTGIRYEERVLGTLQLFRSQAQLDSAQRDIEVLREYGITFQLLDRAGVVACEPGLAHSQAPIAGGLHLPDDETGDCHLFTRQLAERAAMQGVEFRFNQAVDMLCSDRGRITGVAIAGRLERADAYVLAPGSWTASLLAPLGLYLPVYPLKGYSLTLPMIDAQRAPRSTVVDETYKVALTRFEQRIRVGGMAEVCGYDLGLNLRRRDTLLMVLESLYPGSADVGAAEFWTGLRPATPDGPPVVGATPLSNLFLNTGHGTLGWTMACGSARYLSDVIGGRKPAIDPEGLGLARYHAPWPPAPVTR